MNFNLISPTDNGHEFSVRYKEPIVIPPNSSIQLNWVQFERDDTINFTKDQTIQIIIGKIVPSNDLITGFPNGGEEAGNLTYTIKKGSYTTETLQNEITKQLVSSTGKTFCSFNPHNRGITGVDEGILTIDNATLICENYEYASPLRNINGHSISIGFAKRNAFFNTPIFPFYTSRSPLVNAHYKNANGNIIQGTHGASPPYPASYYTASQDGTANDKTFGNSYVMVSEKYFHLGYDLGSFQDYDGHGNRIGSSEIGGFNELLGANVCLWTLTKKPPDLVGRIFVGFHCEELGGVKNGSNSAFDTKNNSEAHNTYTNDQFLAMRDYKNFLVDALNPSDDTLPENLGGILFDKDGIEIYGGRFTSVFDAKLPSGQGADNQCVMKKTYHELGLDMTSEVSPQFGFQIYRPDRATLTTDGSFEDPKSNLYVRCFYQDPSGHFRIFFDSNYQEARQDWVYTKTFQNQFKTGFENNEAKLRSQCPFNVFFASTKSGEGIHNYHQSSLNWKGNSGDDSDPTYQTDSIVESYTVKCSEQLGNLFLLNTGGVELPKRFPSMNSKFNMSIIHNPYLKQPNNVMELYYQINEVISQYRLDRFTIYLNELPIKVYQNTSDKSISGTRKNILSNIPNPFSGASVYTSGQQGNVIGSYVPSLGIQNFLANQLITTNSFSISVRNMDDNTPAEQIKRCVVNFTITPSQ